MKERLLTVLVSVTATIALLELLPSRARELDVDRLIVRRELIVSDSGQPWEKGFEDQQIPRGIYARSVTEAETGGLWVRARLIKGEIDDPFDDRFHAIERDGSPRRAPGHISWNVWLDGHWRQLAIVQGEGLELSELPASQWNGSSHPGRLRVQSFRPGHPEPLTDMVVGQGKMSVGGGGFGGSGLPYPTHLIDLWGGEAFRHPLEAPPQPVVIAAEGSAPHEYAIVALSAEGIRSRPSAAIRTKGRATLRWDGVSGADAYVILRDGKEVTAPLRIEGQVKKWTDR